MQKAASEAARWQAKSPGSFKAAEVMQAGSRRGDKTCPAAGRTLSRRRDPVWESLQTATNIMVRAMVPTDPLQKHWERAARGANNRFSVACFVKIPVSSTYLSLPPSLSDDANVSATPATFHLPYILY